MSRSLFTGIESPYYWSSSDVQPADEAENVALENVRRLPVSFHFEQPVKWNFEGPRLCGRVAVSMSFGRRKTSPATSSFSRVQPELADQASQFCVPEALQNFVLVLAAVLAIGSTVLSPALRRRSS